MDATEYALRSLIKDLMERVTQLEERLDEVILDNRLKGRDTLGVEHGQS